MKLSEGSGGTPPPCILMIYLAPQRLQIWKLHAWSFGDRHEIPLMATTKWHWVCLHSLRGCWENKWLTNSCQLAWVQLNNNKSLFWVPNCARMAQHIVAPSLLDIVCLFKTYFFIEKVCSKPRPKKKNGIKNLVWACMWALRYLFQNICVLLLSDNKQQMQHPTTLTVLHDLNLGCESELNSLFWITSFVCQLPASTCLWAPTVTLRPLQVDVIWETAHLVRHN